MAVLVDALAREADLGRATPADLEALAAAGHTRHLRAGEVLFEVGQPAKLIAWVVDGYLNGSSGRHDGAVTAGFGGPGEGNWGARDAYLGRPQMHRVWATVDSEVALVPLAAMEERLAVSPGLLRGQLAFVLDQLRWNTVYAGEHVELDLTRRLARRLATDFTRGDHVELPLRRDELARVLGASRQELSGAVGRLLGRGLVTRTGRNSLHVSDPAGFEAHGRPAAVPAREAPDLGPGETPTAQDVARVHLGAAVGADRPASGQWVLRRLRAGRLVARRDDPVVQTHALLAGRISLRAPTRAGGFRLADVTAQSGVLGLSSLLAGVGWPTDLVAVTDVTLLSLPAARTGPLDTAAVRRELLTRACAHLAQAAHLRAAMRGLPLTTRLARLVLDRAGADGVVDSPLPRSDLAAELGVSRSALSLALSQLRGTGALTSQRLLQVGDPTALAAAAGR